MTAIKMHAQQFLSLELFFGIYIADNLGLDSFEQSLVIAPVHEPLKVHHVDKAVSSPQEIPKSFLCGCHRFRSRITVIIFFFGKHTITRKKQNSVAELLDKNAFQIRNKRIIGVLAGDPSHREHALPVYPVCVRRGHHAFHHFDIPIHISLPRQRGQHGNFASGKQRLFEQFPPLVQPRRKKVNAVDLAVAHRLHRLFKRRQIEERFVRLIGIRRILVQRTLIPSMQKIIALSSVLELRLYEYRC